MNIAQEGHVAVLQFPASACTASSYFSMAKYAHADILVVNGAAVSAETVTVKRAEDSSGTGASAIAFSYQVETTSGIDLLGARTAATSSGYSLGTGSNQTLVISVDASELTTSSPWVNVNWAGTSTGLTCAIAILTGSRFGETESPTVLS